MKLRAVLILATMVLGVMLLSGVVLAKTCGATCYGDSGDNTLTGTNGKNTIHAKGGGDDVKGRRGKDVLHGGGGGDALAGGAGFDFIEGGSGSDWLNGNRGNDRLRGVEDPTFSSTAHQKTRKVEVLIGESGNDTFRAKDGKKDIIRGGPGRDIAYVDPIDTQKGVEVVRGTPPVATIDSGPQNGAIVTDPNGCQGQGPCVVNVEFTFSANETCTFECRLLKVPYEGPPTLLSSDTSCKSPKTYPDLNGEYIFELRATDTDGNTSEVVSRNFSADP
jgi:hypothetical protein